MLDVKNPEIRVDEIMQRIQEKVRLRREARRATPTSAAPAPFDPSSQRSEEVLARAQELANVGAALPPMTRIHGLKRLVAQAVAKAFLRMAQLITRDQRAFNLTVVDALRTASEQSHRTATQVDSIRADLAGARSDLSQAQARIGQLEEAARRDATKIAQLRTAITLQERRLDQFLEEAKKRLPEPLDGQQVEALVEESPHLWDATYLHFEDEFRGSREDIKQRVSVYLPRFRSAQAGTEAAPILDLGCGRGELLEVLRADGLVASGVDTNRAAVEHCRERGLHVELRDAFEALRKIPDGTLGGLAALHVVEHLPFPLVLKLLDESLRVLRPGGVAVFETPNPTNVLVGSANFYIDPTHRNPVHPLTLRHLMEARGLDRVETIFLHSAPASARLAEDSEVARRFNEHFYGPQDYAIVGYRP